MSASQIDKVVIDGDYLVVSGPFHPQGVLLGDALIHVIIDQRPEDDPAATTKTNGDTRWDQVKNKDADWSVRIPRNGITPGKARGIGAALVLKVANDVPDRRPVDPPAVEAITWCKPVNVEGGGSAAS